MAGTHEHFSVGGKWYDPDNPGELHDDLRADYVATRDRAACRPSVRRHLETCGVCLAIGGATVAAPSPLSTRKRLKLVLNKEQMHRALRLPANFEIVHLYAENDPNKVFVLVAGEGLPEVTDDEATPILSVRLDEDVAPSGDPAHDL